MTKAKILIVEDESIIAWNIKNVLSRFGYDVPAISASGTDALQKVEETQPDLVLMDIRLEGEIDGIEAAEQIRARFNIPIVYLTAHTNDNVIERAKATQPFGYIVKPFQERELNATIEMALYKFNIEKDIRAEREWFSTVLESMGDCVVVTDENGAVTFMNPHAEALTGWEKDEAVGRSVDEVLPIVHSDLSNAENPITKAIERGVIVRLADQWILRTKHGTETPIADSAAPIRDQAGKITGVVAIFQDITERKRFEAALQKSEERFRLLVEKVRDYAIFMLNPDGCVTSWNAGAERTSGYQAQEVIGRHFSCFYLDKEIQSGKPQQALSIAAATGQFEAEDWLVRKDGSRFWADVLITVLSDETGQVYGFSTIIRDITDQKQAAAALQQQAERERLIALISQRIRQSLDIQDILYSTVVQVRQFLQTDRVLIYRFEPDWSGIVAVESVDPSWKSLLGQRLLDPCFASDYVEPYRCGRIQATDDIYNAGLAQCHIELLEQLQVKANLVVPILQGDQLWGLLIAHQCRSTRQWQSVDIDLLWQLSTQVAIAIQQSELYQQVRSLNADLERQVQERTAQLQQALEFEAMLKRITDHVRDSLDETQILQRVTQELTLGLRVYGCDTALYDLDQGTAAIRYEYIDHGIPPAKGRVIEMAHFPVAYQQLLTEKSFQFCELVPTLRGQVTILACPIFDDQGVLGDLWLFKPQNDSFSTLEVQLVEHVANECAIAIRQARLYQEAQAQVTELAKLNRLKDDFLNTISHELRTPISNINLALQMLTIIGRREGVLNPASDQVARYLQVLRDECRREIDLINDLLQLQRLEAETEPLILTTIRLQEWLPAIVESFAAEARDNQQSLQLDVSAKLPRLTTDVTLFDRIVTELLDNACKYTPSSGKITISADAALNQLQLRVSNSGVGIPKAELSRVFDRFYRIPSGNPWKYSGTGFGLALVKKIAEYLGGSIEAQSTADQITFLITLPLLR